MKNKSLTIGEVRLKTPFVLAPLAGITDKAMRSLCTKHGASLVYTEMVSAKGLWYGDRKSRKLLEIGSDEGSVGFQLFGSDPEILAYAAKDLREEKNPVLDLNVGCPVPKIVKNGEGSALLKDLDRLYDVVEAMVKNAGKPVTAKFRMGFERGSDTAVETAKTLEAAGVSAVAIHGRTREQYYEGKADWEVIGRVKTAISVPVIGNGDVMNGYDAVRMLEYTGCDGVMIARGALGNPWIFREATELWEGQELSKPPTDEERIRTLIEHLDMIIDDKGEAIAVREIRKHVGWYVKGMHGATAIRRKVNSISEANELKRLLGNCIHK